MTCRTENLSDKIVHNELIIDSGASHHMTGCLDLEKITAEDSFERGSLAEDQKMPLFQFNHRFRSIVAVELPLDVQSFSAKQGSMRLSSNKFLSNDHVTRTMIGTGEEHDGVFLFRKAKQGYANRAKVDGNFELCHPRLGHSSETNNQAVNGILQQNDDDSYGVSHVSEDIFPSVIPEVTYSSFENVGTKENDSDETNTTNENNIFEPIEEPQVDSTNGNVVLEIVI
ncbi:hypothetical protein Tco_1111319 [Tanacetum coccineum]|uniref:Uncharacterized protein n=1 Tax=Tanacetum coccineum TaxID=301880 RepID=A0ABQ5IMK2_9ASTR